MRSQVKEFFNNLDRTLNKEQKTNKKPKRSSRTVGIRPFIDYKVPNIDEFSHFIECEISPNICPMMWESMDIDFGDSSRRYCEYCDKYIYKADNQYMVNKLTNENKCMAISNKLLEKLNGQIDETRYVNLQKRLNISKLFMFEKKYSPDEYTKMQEDKLSNEEQLKNILFFAIKYKQIKWYMDLGIDMQSIYLDFINNSNDEEFEKQLIEEMKNKGGF